MFAGVAFSRNLHRVERMWNTAVDWERRATSWSGPWLGLEISVASSSATNESVNISKPFTISPRQSSAHDAFVRLREVLKPLLSGAAQRSHFVIRPSNSY